MAKLYGRGQVKTLVKGKKHQIILPCGKDPITGRYRKHKETFYGTKRQAELRLEEIRRELMSGKVPGADRIIMSDWCERYLQMREAMAIQRPNTLKRDRAMSKHIVNRLGSTKLVDIRPVNVNDMYAAMRRDGVGDSTVRHVHLLMKRVMRYALDNDIILRDPMDRVETPRNPKPEREVLSRSEAVVLVRACTGGVPTACGTAAYLGLALGSRIGETLGLRWCDVTLDGARPYVHIIQQHTSDGREAALKTDADDNPTGRIVPIGDQTVAVLMAWRSVQRGQLNMLGIEAGTDTPVITNRLGGYMDHCDFRRWWRSFCVENGFGRWVADDGREVIELAVGDDAGLYPEDRYIVEWRDPDGWPCDEDGRRYSRSHKRPRVKRHYEGPTPHALRRTRFTLMLADGVDIPTCQAVGGWSTARVLMDAYAHPVAENIWKTAGFMGSLGCGRDEMDSARIRTKEKVDG